MFHTKKQHSCCQPSQISNYRTQSCEVQSKPFADSMLAGASGSMLWQTRQHAADETTQLPCNTTTGAYVRLGQREFGAADDVLLADAVLLCAVRADHHLHLLQRGIAAAAAEQPPSLLWPGRHVGIPISLIVPSTEVMDMTNLITLSNAKRLTDAAFSTPNHEAAACWFFRNLNSVPCR